jgi:hypothetical protein
MIGMDGIGGVASGGSIGGGGKASSGKLASSGGPASGSGDTPGPASSVRVTGDDGGAASRSARGPEAEVPLQAVASARAKREKRRPARAGCCERKIIRRITAIAVPPLVPMFRA